MTNRQNAVTLAKMGFEVFPLKTNEKVPAIAVVTGRTTNDPKKVADYWTDTFGESRDLNIGVSTDRLLVIDFDMKLGYPAMDADFERLIKAYPTKHVVQSASGGLHAYYRLPPGVRCANTAKKLGKTVDTRSHHGYVLGVGSSIDGAYYQWLESSDGFEKPNSIDDLAIAPADLIAACGAPAERAERQNGIELDTPAAISQVMDYLINSAPVARQGEGGDDTTYRVACKVYELGVSSDKALELMSDLWNETKAVPPWATEELERKVENAYQYAKNAPHVPGSEFEAVEIGNPISEPAKLASKNPVKKIQRESFAEASDRAIAQKDNPLVEGLLDCGTLAMLYGASNAGKSFVAIDLGCCVAMGRPFAGRKTERGSVLYFGLEAAKGLRKRFATVRKHKAGGANIPMALCTGGINLFTDKNGEDTKAVIEEIADYEKETGTPAKLVIFDTLVRAASGADENGVQDMGPVMERAEAIVNATGVLVLIVHHTGKVLSKGIRGSSAIYAALDSALCVEADEKAPGKSTTGRITTEKQREDAFAPDIPYMLVQKEFDTDAETLKARTSCVVEFPPPGSAAVPAKPLSRVKRESMAAFDAAEREAGAGEWISVKQLVEATGRIGKGAKAASEGAVSKAADRLHKDGLLDKEGRRWRRVVTA